MTVKNLIDALSLDVLNLEDPDREIKGGYCGDLLSWVMGRAKSDEVWVTIMTNINIVAVASLTDPSCIVLAENVSCEQAVIDKASELGVNLLRSSLPSFSLCAGISALIN